MSIPVVLLLGMMGVGKTTVGRAIAQITGWTYVDNDELVEQVAGRTAPEILATGGEDALRKAESAALQRALALRAPAVAGVAGGAVLDPADRERLRVAPGVIWLRARPDTLTRRVDSGAGRAWLQPDPAAAIAELLTIRESYYVEVADAVVDVDNRTPVEVALAVVAAVTERPGGPTTSGKVPQIRRRR